MGPGAEEINGPLFFRASSQCSSYNKSYYYNYDDFTIIYFKICKIKFPREQQHWFFGLVGPILKSLRTIGLEDETDLLQSTVSKDNHNKC